MDYWKILGIKPTSDKALIKKAFAQKVKENPPSKDAQKYQELREAYDRAIKFSSNEKTVRDLIREASRDENLFSEEDEIESAVANSNEESKGESENISLAELSRLRGMFGSFSFRDLRTAIGNFQYEKISLKWALLYEGFWKSMKLIKTFAILLAIACIALVRCLLICSEQ